MTQQQESRNTGKNVAGDPIRVWVESFPPKPTPSHEYDAEKKLEKRLKIGLAVLEFVALIGLIFYAGETRRTNNLTQQSLNASYGTRLKVQPEGIGLRDLKPNTSIVVEFQSAGDRPVTNVSVYTDIEFRTDWPRAPYDVKKSSNIPDEKCERPSLHKCGTPVEKLLPIETYNDYISGRRKLYVWGYVTYNDAASTELHSTNFCRFISVEAVNQNTSLPYFGSDKCD